MLSVLSAAARLVLGLLLVLSVAACSSFFELQDNSDSQLSAPQWVRLTTAIRGLPQPLPRLLDDRQRYRLSSVAPSAGYSDSLIRLDPQLLDNPATSNSNLQREILRQFFGGQVDALDLFCQASHCPALAPRKLQLAQFFQDEGLSAHVRGTDQSLAETYALHASEYMVDPLYRCKRPLVAHVLESVWNYQSAAPPCNQQVPFLVAEGEAGNQIRWVDPARVYAVHLLFAGSTGNSMSRFGHVTLRIVQCAKERKMVDQQCEEDLFDHLSLGFKANIDELDLSLWKGVNGGYTMKLYAKSFIDTYREYSIDEFRNMYSLPLVLSPQDKQLLIAALAEVHWSYSTDYRFFTQNCATQVQWLLNSVVAGGASTAPLIFPNKHYRPDHLFETAQNSTQFRGAVLNNLQTAEQQGYYFPSTQGYYQRAVDNIALTLASSSKTTAHTPQEWEAQPAQMRGAQWLKPALAQAASKAYTGHAALVLEGWVARKLRRKLLSGLTYYYGSIFQQVIEDDHLLNPSDKQLLTDCVTAIKAADSAGISAEGIPQTVPQMPSSVCNVQDEQLVALMRRLFETFPVDVEQRESINELKDTLQNIHSINAAMSS